MCIRDRRQEDRRVETAAIAAAHLRTAAGSAAAKRRKSKRETDKTFQKMTRKVVDLTNDVENFVVRLYKALRPRILDFSELMKMPSRGIILLTGWKY